MYSFTTNKKRTYKAIERSKCGPIDVNKLISTRHPAAFLSSLCCSSALFPMGPALFLVKGNWKNSGPVVP